jgi:putative sterol carrier protein
MSESKEKSTITKKGEINYANPIMIGQLKANKNFFENEKKRFLEMYKTSIDAGKINEQQVDQIIHNTIVEKNILEGVKQYLRQYFTANIDDGEKQFVIEQIKAQVKDMPEDKLEHAAKNIIFEKLLFNYLGNNE